MSSAFAVTFFPDAQAATRRNVVLTLEGLRDLALTTTASTKAALPWLKLAVFGDKRSEKKSLRHDKNVLAITGVELDYDAEVISFDEAKAVIERNRLLTLLYTSPSHSLAKPRWRLLLPTSHQLPPGKREKLTARVNGLFGGVFASESFTLSQSYYVGSVNGNPAHLAVIVEGDFIDLRPDLDATAMGRKKTKAKSTGLDAHLAMLGDGPGLDGFHKPLRDAVASYVATHGAGLDRPALKARLRTAIERAPMDKPRPYLTDDQHLDDLIDSAVAKFGSPHNELIERFNTEYQVVNIGGQTVVFWQKYDPTLKRHYYEAVSFEHFKKLHQNKLVQVGEKKGTPTYKPAGHLWLDHPDRLQFNHVVFDPSGKHVGEGMLNLWRGFAVKPRKGDWELLKAHLRENICAGNTCYFNYTMGWLATLVQFPGQQGEVAVVLQGPLGSGKGIFARAVLRLFGQHGMHISDPTHLTGRFSGHLRDIVFVFADEAFFAGDKAHVGRLKALITEDTQTYEDKYFRPTTQMNYLHLLMSSNESWVVPAALKERRFFVLIVLEDRIGDLPYFDAIQKQLDNGGYEAMLHELLNYPLDGNGKKFNVRDVPQTEGLNQQREQSLDTHHAWWEDVLFSGYVFHSKHGLEKHFQQWEEKVATELLYTAYQEFAKRKNERHPLVRQAFGRFMVEMGCEPKHLWKAIVGEHLADVETENGLRRVAQVVINDRAHGYSLGTLDVAREAFVKATNLKRTWPLPRDDEYAFDAAVANEEADLVKKEEMLAEARERAKPYVIPPEDIGKG